MEFLPMRQYSMYPQNIWLGYWSINTALKPHGVLFCSNPRGPDEEGWNGERYSAYHSLESWRHRLVAADFDYLEHYYRPSGLPREQQPWLASLWRKASGPEIKGGERA